jgi:hypothetical protein
VWCSTADERVISLPLYLMKPSEQKEEEEEKTESLNVFFFSFILHWITN